MEHFTLYTLLGNVQPRTDNYFAFIVKVVQAVGVSLEEV